MIECQIMPRFVVLRHDCSSDSGRGPHWDFMLEVGDSLHTWALTEAPSGEAMRCAAERLPDHRRIYLDYQGEISGGRGTVTRVDAGDYLRRGDQRLVVELHGTLLRGTAALWPPSGGNQRWRFAFEPAGTEANGLASGAAGDPSDPRGTV